MSEIERRAWPFEAMEVRQADGEPERIVGYAAMFNVWSQPLNFGMVERIDPGFFDDVLESDVRALWQHDPSYVLGRTTNGTLKLATDERGLRIEIEPPETGWARDALVSIRRGDVSEMSFGFDVDVDSWTQKESEEPRRTLIKAKSLYDVSPVTFPAYPQTTVEVRNQITELRARPGDDDIEDSAGRLRAQLDLLRRYLKLNEV